MDDQNAIVVKEETGLAAGVLDELAAYAKEASETEQTPGGQFISVKGGVIKVAGQALKNPEVDLYILDFIYENKCYGAEYDPDSPQPPSCYAFARKEEELAPHAKVKTPVCGSCKGCPNNEWGSAEKGKGKACKNIRRLAVIAADGVTTAQQVMDSEIYYLSVPVTSTKVWATYVKGLATVLNLPPFAVVTKFAVKPDPKTQIKLVFTDPRPAAKELVQALMQKAKIARDQIAFPYPDAQERSEGEDEQPKKKRKF